MYPGARGEAELNGMGKLLERHGYRRMVTHHHPATRAWLSREWTPEMPERAEFGKGDEGKGESQRGAGGPGENQVRKEAWEGMGLRRKSFLAIAA
jgi:hypothetical protein